MSTFFKKYFPSSFTQQFLTFLKFVQKLDFNGKFTIFCLAFSDIIRAFVKGMKDEKR